MKPKIHPKYQAVNYTCSCGYTFTVRSTLGVKDQHIDICSQCHPFYTGKQKLLDTAGRVDRFNKKFGKKKKEATK